MKSAADFRPDLRRLEAQPDFSWIDAQLDEDKICATSTTTFRSRIIACDCCSDDGSSSLNDMDYYVDACE